MTKQSAPALTELERFFISLRSLEFSPTHIVDVGAHRGGWTRVARQFFPSACYTLIEPQADLCQEMSREFVYESKVSIHNTGVGSSKGVAPFTITERPDSCTFKLDSDEAERRGLRQIEVPVTTLDAIVSESNYPSPDIIKIDAEGYDLEVLRGASSCLKTCEIVLVEAGIMNKQIPNDLKTVIDELERCGYRPFDITDLNRTAKTGSLWLVEMAFARRDGVIDSSIRSYA